jgi:hypothetical protein
MDTLQLAADEYLVKRTQMGSRKAAAHIIQTYGITASQLSGYLSERGMLLVQSERRATPRPFEVETL